MLRFVEQAFEGLCAVCQQVVIQAHLGTVLPTRQAHHAHNSTPGLQFVGQRLFGHLHRWIRDRIRVEDDINGAAFPNNPVQVRHRDRLALRILFSKAPDTRKRHSRKAFLVSRQGLFFTLGNNQSFCDILEDVSVEIFRNVEVVAATFWCEVFRWPLFIGLHRHVWFVAGGQRLSLYGWVDEGQAVRARIKAQAGFGFLPTHGTDTGGSDRYIAQAGICEVFLVVGFHVSTPPGSGSWVWAAWDGAPSFGGQVRPESFPAQPLHLPQHLDWRNGIRCRDRGF